MKRNLAIVGIVALFGSVVCFQQLRAQSSQTPPPTFGGAAGTTGSVVQTATKATDKPAAPTAAKPISYEYKIDEVCAYLNPSSSTALLSDLNEGGWEINAVIPEASDLLSTNANSNPPGGGLVLNPNSRTVHYTQIVLRRAKK